MASSPEPPRRADPSRARDHLANERTYLAWVRTAAAVMALGLAVAAFGNRTATGSLVAGGILVAVGAGGVAMGTVRYQRVNQEIETDRFVTGSRALPLLISSGVLVLAVLAALLLVALSR